MPGSSLIRAQLGEANKAPHNFQLYAVGVVKVQVHDTRASMKYAVVAPERPNHQIKPLPIKSSIQYHHKRELKKKR